MEFIKKILRTPTALVVLLAAIVALVGVIYTAEKDKDIVERIIRATQTAEAKPSPYTPLVPTDSVPTASAHTPLPSVKLSDAGWYGEYFNNINFSDPPLYERDDSYINFDWNEFEPAPEINSDNFSVRWTQCRTFEGGTYTFKSFADEYLEAWLDDEMMLLNVSAAASVSRVPLQQRYYLEGYHCLKVEYIERIGFAYVYFDFEMD